MAFSRRCEELDDARHKLQYHLQKVGPRGTPTAGHAHPSDRTQDTPASKPIPRLGRTHSHLDSPHLPLETSSCPLALALPSLIPLTAGTRVAIYSMLSLHRASRAPL